MAKKTLGVIEGMELVKSSGLNFQEILREVGISGWEAHRAEKIGLISDWKLDHLRKALRKRGLRFLRLSRSGQVDLAGLKKSAVARQLGISQQALSEFSRYPELMPETRKAQVLEVLEKVGKTLLKVSK